MKLQATFPFGKINNKVDLCANFFAVNIKKFFKENGFMKEYHKPEMELTTFEVGDVLNLSADTPFNDEWFSTKTGGDAL